MSLPPLRGRDRSARTWARSREGRKACPPDETGASFSCASGRRGARFLWVCRAVSVFWPLAWARKPPSEGTAAGGTDRLSGRVCTLVRPPFTEPPFGSPPVFPGMCVSLIGIPNSSMNGNNQTAPHTHVGNGTDFRCFGVWAPRPLRCCAPGQAGPVWGRRLQGGVAPGSGFSAERGWGLLCASRNGNVRSPFPDRIRRPTEPLSLGLRGVCSRSLWPWGVRGLPPGTRPASPSSAGVRVRAELPCNVCEVQGGTCCSRY